MAAEIGLPLISTEFGHAAPPADGHPADHAITLHIPKWQSIVDFSAGKPELLSRIKDMYPRVMTNKLVKALSAKIVESTGAIDQACLLYPTLVAATECRDSATSDVRKEHKLQAADLQVRAFQVGETDLFTVFYPKDKPMSVMPYWVNVGVGISTRMAEHGLKHLDSLKEIDLSPTTPASLGARETEAHAEIKGRITSLLGRALRQDLDRPPATRDDVFLYQTGMAAIYHVHQTLRSWRPGTTIMFGFAFSSTPKSLGEFGGKFEMFGRGTEFDELEAFVQAEIREGRRVQSVLCEFPANPLLATPDLDQLRHLADKYDFVLVVDDTISSFCNVDLLGAGGADVLISSLTKSFSGYADVMGGSAVLNPSSRYYDNLRSSFRKRYTNELFAADAGILASNSRDYLARSTILHRNAQGLVDQLTSLRAEPHSPISRVYYPTTLESGIFYRQTMRASTADFNPGYGCLFSIDFHTVEATQAFNDEIGRYLHIGPHLGAHVTLVLAFNRAIFGNDLDRVGPWGISETQMRVSVGLEDVEVLKAIFRRAVEVARAAVG